MHEVSSVGALRWTDIGGYEGLKKMFQTQIQERLSAASCPESDVARIAANLLLNVPRGVLLHGPPGCSKTMFVRALATECQLPLIAVQSSRIFGRYVGDSERNIRRILMQAKASAPAILFIDEIDLLLPSRNSSETGVSEHVLSEVLTAIDGVGSEDELAVNQGRLIFIGATNRMDKLDSALSRAGRFDLVLHVPPPDPQARLEILHKELSRRATDIHISNVNLRNFAFETLEEYTGAECVRIVQTAAEFAAQSRSARISLSNLYDAARTNPPRSLREYSAQTKPEEPDSDTESTNENYIKVQEINQQFVSKSRFDFVCLLFLSLLILIFGLIVHIWMKL
ncbi:hypothetical protein Ciccas_006840 [Cichlidogyrus casuarinus]|uniref:AAA+ ATPase domain-containing protein n=1 Tax=Cichlidogyrus casuarinus TaxID=1844966 RepID=A0ABD2Q4M7_9PLAT